jgi:glycine betaine catabolism B
LPIDAQQKLAFIAGGIGITPFRSMAKNLVDRSEKRDVILLYSNRTAGDITYREVFDEAAQKIGMKTVYTLSSEEKITAETIQKEIPDYKTRIFYISGTQAMTNSFKDILMSLGVPRAHIKIDFFPGFA